MRKIGSDTFKFSTGKKLYAHNCIIGLSAESSYVSQGYDGGFSSREDLTAVEIKELANYMIDLWTKWKEGKLP